LPKGVRLDDALSLGSGDVLVGAYARRLARQRLAMVAFGVLLLTAALLLYWNLQPGGEGPGMRPVVVRCVECQFEGQMMVPVAARGSFECPSCQARGAREIWACRRCGERFLPPMTYELRKCPKCGSEEVGSAVAAGGAAAPAKVATSNP
jgi:hypothetical protein